jgi:hypothetical protein
MLRSEWVCEDIRCAFGSRFATWRVRDGVPGA